MAADKTEGDGAQQITEETPVYREPVEPVHSIERIEAPPLIDPWVELTDGGADADDDDEPEVIDALGWVEQDFPPDGPVAAPLDDPPSTELPPTADLFPSPAPALAPPRPRPRVPSMRARMIDELDPSQYQNEVRQLLNQPVVVPRKTPARKASGVVRRELTPTPTPTPPTKAKPGVKTPTARAPARQYPKMLSLLKDADVPYGIEPKAAPAPPPVPGTFFPAPRAPLVERPATADLDELLAAMAEGLLIGESPDGGTEVRVTLRDEFFAGTELRIRVNEGTVSAALHPPDRDIYWQLNGNIDELRDRLAGRGLVVRELVVVDPNER